MQFFISMEQGHNHIYLDVRKLSMYKQTYVTDEGKILLFLCFFFHESNYFVLSYLLVYITD